MKAAEGNFGRVFILRMEHGDVLPDCLEEFAAAKGVRAGCAMMVGGIGEGEIVVGPREANARPPEPMGHELRGAHEVAAVGVIAPGVDGKPTLHMHGALGREDKTITGCLRKGVKTWLTGEVVLYEITGTRACRVMDHDCGFALLEPLGVPTAGLKKPEVSAASGAIASAPSTGTAVAGPKPGSGAGDKAATSPEAQDRNQVGGATRIMYMFNAEMH